MSDRQTVTLDYPGLDVAGVDFETWCEVFRMAAARAFTGPRLAANAFLVSVVTDGTAVRHERLEAARLLLEVSK